MQYGLVEKYPLYSEMQYAGEFFEFLKDLEDIKTKLAANPHLRFGCFAHPRLTVTSNNLDTLLSDARAFSDELLRRRY
jgi:hypothetical protein